MAQDPDLELQGAIITRLRADVALTELVGSRVYDRVPKEAPFPYVSYGPVDMMSEDADCINGFNIAVQIDVWSRAVGTPEAKRIGNAVRRALHDADLALPTNAFVLLRHMQSRTFSDPDGLTSHRVIAFESIVEHPD
jgi:hypothetical protein